LPNIQLENLFEAEGIILGAVFDEFEQVSSDNSELINVNIAKHRNGPMGLLSLPLKRTIVDFGLPECRRSLSLVVKNKLKLSFSGRVS
jgi:hypothetical protein